MKVNLPKIAVLANNETNNSTNSERTIDLNKGNSAAPKLTGLLDDEDIKIDTTD